MPFFFFAADTRGVMEVSMKHLKDYIYQIKRYYYTARIEHDVKKAINAVDKLSDHIDSTPSFKDMNIDKIFSIQYRMWTVRDMLCKMDYDAMKL